MGVGAWSGGGLGGVSKIGTGAWSEGGLGGVAKMGAGGRCRETWLGTWSGWGLDRTRWVGWAGGCTDEKCLKDIIPFEVAAIKEDQRWIGIGGGAEED